MLHGCTAWLVCNSASGSNDAAALEQLERALADAGCKLLRKLSFPQDSQPSVDELREAGVEMVVIFAGDGTVNSVVTRLFGWEGALLILPGGTMNLLSRRLHGDASSAEIVDRLKRLPGRIVRPTVIGMRNGCALTGILAGPGAAWNDVREAMRAADVPEMLETATEAIGESIAGARVILQEPAIGREEGYPAIMVTPFEDGLEARGYYAESLFDYASQALALARGDFRDGPHDLLGKSDRIELVSPEGKPMDLLMDGEPLDGTSVEEFRLVRCGVDLLATDYAC